MSELIVEVCKIEKIERHPNADRLDVATVKGWNCIVGRHEFTEGDLCVYIPIDAILPDELENILFSGTQVKLKKHRVRTIKLRGVVSQGLVVRPRKVDLLTVKIGDDVATKLGITKYEPKAHRPHGMATARQAPKRHLHPDFKKYTGIQHFSNFPTMLADTSGEVVITEKIHGTNFRCGWLDHVARTFFDKLKKSFWPFWKQDEFVFGSHNVQLQDGSRKQFYSDNVYAKIVHDHKLKQKLELMKGFIFYGEIFGDGIQKGYTYGYGPRQIDVRWIDIYFVKERRYLDWDELCAVSRHFDLKLVPKLARGPLEELDVVKYLCGRSTISERQRHREGIVIRSVREFNGHGGRSILKMLNPDYLLLKDNTEWH